MLLKVVFLTCLILVFGFDFCENQNNSHVCLVFVFY